MSDTQAQEKRAPYDYNVATLPDADTQNGKNWGDKLELIGSALLVAFDKRERCKDPNAGDGFATVIDARWYMARHSDGASPIRCSVWIRTRRQELGARYFAGHGTASGYGYHKQSAALDAALDSAGIKLEKRFDGCGGSAAKRALEAVARASGYARIPFTIVTTGSAL